MSRQRVLVLSSTAPSYAHFRAAQTVLAHLLEELARLDLDVRYAVAAPPPGADENTEQRLRHLGVVPVPGAPPALASTERPTSIVARGYEMAREIVVPQRGHDNPRFVAPEREVERLAATGAEAAILFWDTSYEQLVPLLAAAGLPAFGYLARPPFAAAQTAAPERFGGLRLQAERALLHAKERRHLARLRHLANARNICAIDAAWYGQHAVACRYLPNTWPDPAGEAWAATRYAAESRRAGIHMLANIGGLNATGNRYGMTFFADRVLPLLDRRLSALDWTANICGRFDLPSDLAHLGRHPHVAVRGFVPDIDEEMAGNHLFLLFNNSGPYTGGYTRVIYAFATGACLIAHRRLADSMPELIGGENCLLGDSPDEIAGLIEMAAADAELRARLGAAARRTYLDRYHPTHIARGLRDMIDGSVH